LPYSGPERSPVPLLATVDEGEKLMSVPGVQTGFR
jgi:hypothetical protein